MRPNWPKLASMAQKTCNSIVFSSLVKSLLPRDNPFIEHIELYYSLRLGLCGHRKKSPCPSS